MGEMQPGVVYVGNIALLQPGVVYGGNVVRSGLWGKCSQEWAMREMQSGVGYGGNVVRSGLWGKCSQEWAMGKMQSGVVDGGNIACLQPGVVFCGTVAEGGKVCVVSIIYIVIALFSAAELTRCTCVLYSLAGYLKRRKCGPTHLYFVGKMQNLDGVKNKPKKHLIQHGIVFSRNGLPCT